MRLFIVAAFAFNAKLYVFVCLVGSLIGLLVACLFGWLIYWLVRLVGWWVSFSSVTIYLSVCSFPKIEHFAAGSRTADPHARFGYH